MRTRFKDLTVGQIDLHLSGQALWPSRIALKALCDVNGTLESVGKQLTLNDCSCSSLQLTSLDGILDRLDISLGAPAQIDEVNIQAVIETQDPTKLALSIAQATIPRIGIELDSTRVSGDISVERVRLHTSTGMGSMAWGKSVVENIQAVLGAWFARIDTTALGPTLIQWEKNQWTAGVAEITIRNMHLRSENLTVDIGTLVLQNITCTGQSIHVGEIVISDVSVQIEDITRFPIPRPSGILALEKTLLDTLNGQFDFDLSIDATVPVLGRRNALHKFRIAIEDGIINYKHLEKDLAFLEGLFIDIALQGENLILAREVPLIPGTQKPLVTWPLNPVERELAKKKLVRIRSLLAFSVPTTEEDPRVTLHDLNIPNICARLALTPPPQPDRQTFNITLASLTIDGALDHNPNPP